MKILHLISQYPDATGSGIYLRSLLRQAALSGHENSVIAACNQHLQPSVPEHCRSFTTVPFGSAPLDFALPGMSDVMPYESSLFRDFTEERTHVYEKAFLGVIDKEIAFRRPDIIHSHHLWLLSSLVKRSFTDIPMVTSCHGSDLRQFHFCPHLRPRVLSGCRDVEAVLALTSGQKAEINRLYEIPPESIHITGSGFNDELFYWQEKETPPPFHIAYCGKLSRAKGVPWLLRALKHLGAQDFRLHLIGSGTGEDARECTALADSLGDKVIFHGSLPQGKVAHLLRLSHIFVLPSLYEGLPLVLLEALACGCQVIATDLPGCREIKDLTKSPNLLLFPPPRLHAIDRPYTEDEEEFEENIGEELRRACLLWRRHPSPQRDSFDSVTTSFAWTTVFSGIEKIYQQLTTPPQQASI